MAFFAQTRTELGWNGHGDVIYTALEPLLYQREAAIIQPLVSCLITVLGKVVGGYIRDEPNYQVRGKWFAAFLLLTQLDKLPVVEQHLHII